MSGLSEMLRQRAARMLVAVLSDFVGVVMILAGVKWAILLIGLVQAFSYPDWAKVGPTLAGDVLLIAVGMFLVVSGTQMFMRARRHQSNV